MGDQRMSNLVVCNSYPELLEKIDLIKVLHKFVSKTSHTGRREILFGKFVGPDLKSRNGAEVAVPQVAVAMRVTEIGVGSLKDDKESDYDCENW